jgi:hypothetical protein
VTRRTASRSTLELLALLQDSEGSNARVTASDINRATAERMFNSVQRAKESLSARFVGGTADAHRLSARSSTKALLALQESLSSIGARLSGLTSIQGPLPTAILEATELSFSPNVLPGSVIFELSRPTDAENMLANHEDRPLLDESFDKLFELVAAVMTANTPETVPAAVRELGPRAARHIFDLCAILVDESLGVDLVWVNRAGSSKKSVLSNSAADHLMKVAAANRSVTTSETIEGLLLTVSVESKQKIRIRPEGGSVISMRADPIVRSGLAEHYNKQVRVNVDRTETINLSTGRLTVTYALTSISAPDEAIIDPEEIIMDHGQDVV